MSIGDPLRQDDVPSSRRSHSAGSGFSLTELLVVIAVIAVVIAIMMPALLKSKHRARAAVCSNNLRQLCALMSMYVHENGHYPDGKTNATSVWLAFGGDGRALGTAMNCPEISGGHYQPKFYGSGGYGRRPNLGLRSDIVSGPLPDSGIAEPSDMIAILDFVFLLFPPRCWHGGPDPGLPHFGGLQFSFCDGHVEHGTAGRFTEAIPRVRRRWNNDHEPHDETW